jgi:hypothetical protein
MYYGSSPHLVIHPARPCTRCGSPGPFYASAPYSWCVACMRETAAARYHADPAQAQARSRAQRLAEALRVPEGERTRRQLYRVLRSQLRPGLKLCPYCCTGKRPSKFRRSRRNKDGRDDYCRACRGILRRLRRHHERHGGLRVAD